jgi:hypothetical protein
MSVIEYCWMNVWKGSGRWQSQPSLDTIPVIYWKTLCKSWEDITSNCEVGRIYLWIIILFLIQTLVHSVLHCQLISLFIQHNFTLLFRAPFSFLFQRRCFHCVRRISSERNPHVFPVLYVLVIPQRTVTCVTNYLSCVSTGKHAWPVFWLL